MRERRIVAEFVADAVESTGGLFVSLAEDPPEFPERFVEGSRQAEIPCEALDPDRVMVEEPAIRRGIRRAFSVLDATIDPWRPVNRLGDYVNRRGGRVLARRAVNRSRPTGNLDTIVSTATVRLDFDRSSILAVGAVAQFLARPESRHVPGGKRYRRPGPGVAADPRSAETEREAAEAPDLDPPTAGETLCHVFEHHPYRELDVALNERGLLLRDALDQRGLRHRRIVARPPRGRDPAVPSGSTASARRSSSALALPSIACARASLPSHSSRTSGLVARLRRAQLPGRAPTRGGLEHLAEVARRRAMAPSVRPREPPRRKMDTPNSATATATESMSDRPTRGRLPTRRSESPPALRTALFGRGFAQPLTYAPVGQRPEHHA